MNLRTTLLATAVGLLFATAAQANVVTFTGNTSGGPTYDRLDVDSSNTLGGPSATGTAVNYRVATFTVAATGTYSVTTAGTFDTMGFLYSGVFNASSPSSGALKGNDDLVAGIGTSGLTATLTAGTVYSYVTTSFLNGQGGVFTNSINGDGAIVPITLPAASGGDPKLKTFTGTTTGGPTYNRADEFFALSSDGSSVAYRTFRFTVGAIGTYSFVANGDYDTFLSLYTRFDPSNPLANLLGDNDDAYNNSDFLHDVSALAVDLLPGVTYTLVTSAYASDESGFFSNAIVGPGAITAVPEPGIATLLLSGVVVMGLANRRRRGARATMA